MSVRLNTLNAFSPHSKTVRWGLTLTPFHTGRNRLVNSPDPLAPCRAKTGTPAFLIPKRHHALSGFLYLI